MAFKKMKEFNEERFGNFFLLRDNGDSADVIFLYQSYDDVLEADVHYIKSSEYSGYVHCCGVGCPACEKGIRVQPKLFIPLYNITTGQIELWDRSTRFEMQLNSDVFSKYPNPSEYVFRITRQGAAFDMNTKYSIVAVGKNSDPMIHYHQILAANKTDIMTCYSNACKELNSVELSRLLTPSNSASTSYSASNMPNYQVTPRAVSSTTTVPDLPDLNLPDEPNIGMPNFDDNSSEESSSESNIPDLDDNEEVVF